MIKATKTGRPKKDNAITKLLSFKCDPELADRLDAYCKQAGRSRGDVIRAALEKYISGEQ